MGVTAAELVARVTADLSPADSALNNWVRGVGGKGGPLAGLGTVFGGVLGGNLASSAIKSVGRGLVDLGRMGVGAFMDMASSGMDFAATMDGINAVIGATAAQQEGLRDLVLDLGADTQLKVSLDEAAAIVKNLGTAGVAYEEIMQGAARSTVLLANATGGDFGQAATVVTDAMALFGIQGEDMAATIDNIAAVANVSKFDLNDYAGALAQSGGVAALAGVEHDDFNTIIAATASYFNSGSDAGTSFKTFLQRLQPTTKEAKELMGELGLLTAEGTSRFFDQTGALRDMQEVAGIMNDTFGDMTEAQQSFYLGQLFGTDAMRMAAAIAGTTREEYAALQAQMGDISAMEMAATATDNAASAWEAFGEAVKTARIRFWEDSGLEGLSQRIAQGLGGLVSAAQPYLDAWAGQLSAWMDATITAIDAKARAMGTAFNEGFAASQAQGDTWWVSVAEGVNAALAELGGAESKIAALGASLPGAVARWQDAGSDFSGVVTGIVTAVGSMAGMDVSGASKLSQTIGELDDAIDGLSDGTGGGLFAGLVGAAGALTGATVEFDSAAQTMLAKWDKFALEVGERGLKGIQVGKVNVSVETGEVTVGGVPFFDWLKADIRADLEGSPLGNFIYGTPVDVHVEAKVTGTADSVRQAVEADLAAGSPITLPTGGVVVQVQPTIEVLQSQEEGGDWWRAVQKALGIGPYAVGDAWPAAKSAMRGLNVEVPITVEPKVTIAGQAAGAVGGGLAWVWGKVEEWLNAGEGGGYGGQGPAPMPIDITVDPSITIMPGYEDQLPQITLTATIDKVDTDSLVGAQAMLDGSPLGVPAEVSGVEFHKEQFTETYGVSADVATAPAWHEDAYSTTYDVSAQVPSEADVAWGAHSHIYRVKAAITEFLQWAKPPTIYAQGVITGWAGNTSPPSWNAGPPNNFNAPSVPNNNVFDPVRNAMGDPLSMGGLRLVGERGPELVRLPRASRVYTNDETERMFGGNKTINIYPVLNTPADQEMLMHKLRRLLRD